MLNLPGEPVKILLYRPGRIILYTDLAEDGFMVISDTYFPGWTAEVHGREERILRADHAFQSVRLDRGPNQVTLTYQPQSIRIGLWASLAAALSFLIAVVWRAFISKPGRRRAATFSVSPGKFFFDK